ncbi:unnamed protein product, partial [Ectocarpus sp. 4 AP-2014]
RDSWDKRGRRARDRGSCGRTSGYNRALWWRQCGIKQEHVAAGDPSLPNTRSESRCGGDVHRS